MANRLGPPPRHFGVGPITHRLAAGDRLWRIYFRGGAYPTAWSDFRRFGPTGSRFDHHTRPRAPQRRGIVYATGGPNAIPTAIAEVFQETRHVDRARGEPWLVCLQLTAPLALLDTGSTWPVRAGGNLAINSGAKSSSRAWSRRIYASYPAVAGIWYPSSLTNHPCAALYERAAPSLPSAPLLNLPLTHPGLLANLTVAAAGLKYRMS